MPKRLPGKPSPSLSFSFRARSAQILVMFHASAAALWSIPGGVHTSSIIAMSEPMTDWMSTTFSGVKMCFEPSMWLWNVTPFSLIFLRPDSEKTWNPPESVSMFLSQWENAWRPP